jgi:hypothetical protein
MILIPTELGGSGQATPPEPSACFSNVRKCVGQLVTTAV